MDTKDIVVLGIDPSLTETGLCFYNISGKYAFETIKGKKLRGVERLAFFRKSFSNLIYQYNPVFAIIENYAYATGHSGKPYTTGELGGVFRLALYDNTVAFNVVAPPSVKKYCTGSGRADKNVILKEVFRRWEVDVTSDDLADAFVIAKIAEAVWSVQNNRDIILTKTEREVVNKILNENSGDNQ